MELCIKTKDRAKSLNSALSRVIVFHIYFMQCKNMLVSTCALYNYNGALNAAALIIIAFLYVRLALRWQLLRHIKKETLIALLLIILFWLLSFAADPRLFVTSDSTYKFVLRNLRLFAAYCLPLFAAVSSLHNTDELLERLYRYLPFSFAVGILAAVLSQIAPMDGPEAYSMSYGSNLLLTCVLLLFFDLKCHRMRNIVCFVLATGLIVTMGNRGPLVSIFALLVYYALRKKKTKTYTILMTVGLALAICIVFFYKSILAAVISVLARFGITSRTLLFLENDLITYDSGRNEFHEGVIGALSRSPILGLGAFGGEKTVGLTHSLYLDILANFGYIFGVLFILLLLWRIIAVIRSAPKSSCSDLILMMAIISFPRGGFNGSFWSEWELWFIMGLLIAKGSVLAGKAQNRTPMPATVSAYNCLTDDLRRTDGST